MYEPHINWGNDYNTVTSHNYFYLEPPHINYQDGSGIIPIMSGYRLPCSGADLLFPNQPLASGSTIISNYSFEHLKIKLLFAQNDILYNSGIYIHDNCPTAITGWPTSELIKLCPIQNNNDLDRSLYGIDFNNRIFYTVAERSGAFYGKYVLQFDSFDNYNLDGQFCDSSGLPVAKFTRKYKPYNPDLDIEMLVYHYRPTLNTASYGNRILPLKLNVYFSGEIIFECVYREYFEKYISGKENGIIDYDIKWFNTYNNYFAMTKKTIPGYLYSNASFAMAPQLLKIEDNNRILKIDNLKFYDLFLNSITNRYGEAGFKDERLFNRRIIPFSVDMPIILPSSYLLPKMWDNVYDNFIFDSLSFIKTQVMDLESRKIPIVTSWDTIDLGSEGPCIFTKEVANYGIQYVPRSGIIRSYFRYNTSISDPYNNLIGTYISVIAQQQEEDIHGFVLSEGSLNGVFENGVEPDFYDVGTSSFLHYPINNIYIYPLDLIPSGSRSIPVWIQEPIHTGIPVYHIDNFTNLVNHYAGQAVFTLSPIAQTEVYDAPHTTIINEPNWYEREWGYGNYQESIYHNDYVEYNEGVACYGPRNFAGCGYNGCVGYQVTNIITLRDFLGYSTEIKRNYEFSKYPFPLYAQYYTYVYTKDAKISWT